MLPLTANDYSIYFNDDIYTELNRFLAENNYSGIYIIVDENTADKCLPILLEQIETDIAYEIIEVESGEATKSIEICAQVWLALTELGADRKSLILNLGGGVVTDLGGFIASTYKRGIDFIHIPTTLLGMVDASIGGKNGVDLGNLKNQIGVITSPKMVLIDSLFLDTLPQNEMLSGMAEMLKHGLIYDREYWNKFLDLRQLDYSALDELIYRSVEIKNEIVINDPTEQNLRKALNFGHTLGHAIESYFMEHTTEDNKRLLHGEAVAIGMVLESYISLHKGLITLEEYSQIKNLIISMYGLVAIESTKVDQITALLIHDKKNEYGKIQFVLLDGIGKVAINQLVENDVIASAFEDYKT